MKSRKKLFAPILITVLTVLYELVYCLFLMSALTGIWKILLGVIPLALAFVMVGVCVERIREIRKGEDNDLSQY